MIQVAVKTRSSAQVVVTAITFFVGVAIAAAFIQVGQEFEIQRPSPVARQFIELEPSFSVTTTESFSR